MQIHLDVVNGFDVLLEKEIGHGACHDSCGRHIAPMK